MLFPSSRTICAKTPAASVRKSDSSNPGLSSHSRRLVPSKAYLTDLSVGATGSSRPFSHLTTTADRGPRRLTTVPRRHSWPGADHTATSRLVTSSPYVPSARHGSPHSYLTRLINRR